MEKILEHNSSILAICKGRQIESLKPHIINIVRETARGEVSFISSPSCSDHIWVLLDGTHFNTHASLRELEVEASQRAGYVHPTTYEYDRDNWWLEDQQAHQKRTSYQKKPKTDQSSTGSSTSSQYSAISAVFDGV